MTRREDFDYSKSSLHVLCDRSANKDYFFNSEVQLGQRVALMGIVEKQ